MKQRWARILLYAVLVGWCLLFLRCETTEKSMIRAVYLEQKEQTWSMGLLYQSPEAAADAADASAALRIARWPRADIGNSPCRCRRNFAADGRLSSVRLCTVPGADGRRRALCIRSTCAGTRLRAHSGPAFLHGIDLEILLQSCGKTETLPDKLLDKLKADSAAMPRLYAHEESMLLPVLCLPEAQEGKVMVSGQRGPSAPGAVRCSA